MPPEISQQIAARLEAILAHVLALAACDADWDLRCLARHYEVRAVRGSGEISRASASMGIRNR